MITTRDAQMIVGSSLEELTASINEYLDPALESLHTAISTVLAKHPILPLYEWLYTETAPYLKNAASAGFNEKEYLANYSLAVQQTLVAELEKESYKAISERKHDLFNQLFHFYKTIMFFKLEMGKKILAVNHDRLSQNFIDKVNFDFALTKKTHDRHMQEVRETQESMTHQIAQLTKEKIIENLNLTVTIKQFLNHQQDDIVDKHEKILAKLKESKEDPETLLEHVQDEIKRVNKETLCEQKIDVSALMQESFSLNNIAHQINTLVENSEGKENVKKLEEICVAIDEIKQDLLRQKNFIKILSEEKNVKPVNIDDVNASIELLKMIVCKQADWILNRAWNSVKKGSILEALGEVKHATMLTYVFSPICNAETLSDRRNALSATLHSLDQKNVEITQIKIEITASESKTKELKLAFDEQILSLKKSIKHEIHKIQRHEMRLSQTQLNKNKEEYLKELYSIEMQCHKKIKNQTKVNTLLTDSFKPISHFKKSTRFVAVPGALSGFSGVAISAMAIAAFVSATPIGWGIAASVVSLLLFGGTGILLTKAHNRYKKNKLLNKYSEDVKDDLFRRNENLKKQKFCSTTRHLMMEYNIRVKEQNRNDEKEMECEMHELNAKIRLFLNVETKKLLIKSMDSFKQEIVDENNFETQLMRFRNN